MTQNKKAKKVAREYAEKHGVSYTEALRITQAEHEAEVKQDNWRLDPDYERGGHG